MLQLPLALPYMPKGQYTPECFILVVCDVGNCCSGYTETAAVAVSARLRQASKDEPGCERDGHSQCENERGYSGDPCCCKHPSNIHRSWQALGAALCKLAWFDVPLAGPRADLEGLTIPSIVLTELLTAGLDEVGRRWNGETCEQERSDLVDCARRVDFSS